MKKSIPRQQAIKNNDKTYEGRPCKEGHTKRYTSNKNCKICLYKMNEGYRKNNKEKIKEYGKQYRQRPEVKKHHNEWKRKRYTEDKVVKVKKLIQCSLWHFCKSKGGTKTRRTEELLDYTVEELKEHLESLFKDGMTWENQGKWHIDHRIPQSYFTEIDQLKECFALENLKPEWGKWNQSKGNRFIG